MSQGNEQAKPPILQVSSAQLPTRFGNFRISTYAVEGESEQPIVLSMGDLSSAMSPLVRIHSSCFTGDLLSSLRCDCGNQLHLAMSMIAEEGVGAVVYLHQEGRGIGLPEKIKAYGLQDEGLDTVDANLALGHKVDARDYSIGTEILQDLGLNRIRLLTNNPRKTKAVISSGVRVDEQIPVRPPANEYNEGYLETKRDRLGHSLP